MAAAVDIPAPLPMEHVMALSPEPHEAKPSIESAPKPANALTPPTSEEMNLDERKQEHEDSELSDLDLDDEDDGEEIEPDHYWDNGKIPVFKPTMDQFRSFKKFVEKIDKYGMKSGIVKVIPPPEWRQSLPALDEHIKRIKIKNPITQEFNGTQGVYTQQNVEKQRSYNLPEWKALTESTHYQPPAKRGERRRNQEKVVRGAGNPQGRTSTPVAASEADDSPKLKRKPGRPPKKRGPPSKEDEEESEMQVPPTPETPATTPAKVPKPKGRPPKSGGGAGQTKSVSSRRLNNTTETADYIDEAAFKNFKYGLDDLDEYTPERCAELETHYWKSLGFNQPMYAADMPGSLFDDDCENWNVAKLENLLDVLGTKVPGVNTAYLYMGMWKATFAWHLEDVDLYSINYIHFGAPKQWYSISQEDARKFEKAMKTVWPGDAKSCDQFLRHKTYLISPDVLQKQYGVKVNKLVHYEGEFVITFPYGYHSGYNIGYNCAESVNFATESWLEFGRIARKCNCEADNVWVDVFEVERKLRGEPTPEYYEETDDSDMDGEDGLPSPPASVKGKPGAKKRKRGVKQEEPKKKKKIRIKIRTSKHEPCTMCPNDNPWDPLLPTENGKKAHRSCALYTPETFVLEEDGKEKVCGITTIDRARLDLKCNYCRSKRGACFQCSSKKCTRAFHASCALAAGVQIDAGMVPTFGEDGTEYFEWGYDFRCKYHRPKMPKNLTVEMLENSKRLVNYGKELKANDVIQAQLLGGDVFAGLVVENRPGEMSVVVDVLFEGERVEIEYKWLCLMDPDDSQRPKPSSSAIPMPPGMNKKALSMNNRQDGVPTQDDAFHDNLDYKWFDFYNMDMPPPGYVSSKVTPATKLTIDFDKPDQLYYYLGEQSTEAKCFFTDKPGSNEIVAKANFIDRVQPRQVYQYLGPKQPIAAAAPRQIAANLNNYKPYVYKPKLPLQAHNPLWHIDHQALANQRSFLTDSACASRPSQQSPHQFASSPNGTSSGSPLRAFPRDAYYSLKTLPAAYPGQHSGFTKAARSESQGSQTMQKPDLNYQSVRQQQQAQMQQNSPGAPVVPNMYRSPFDVLPPNPYSPQDSRPPSSGYTHHSPYGPPATPGMGHAHSPMSYHGPPTDAEYLANLQKYPYLVKSYCRKSKVYESPYPLGGGFAAVYQPSTLPQQDSERKSFSTHTPQGSVGSLVTSERRASQPWTPPSQVWDQVGLTNNQTPPPRQQLQPIQPRQYPQPTHSTPQEFQRQINHFPSTASREGAHARMLRDQGYSMYTPHPYPRNSFGQAYDTARMYNSPKAPTPSPLSDPNTPGNVRPWGTLPRVEAAPALQRASAGGYGPPFLPQMQNGEEK